ncbi:MAG: Lrp/AsnC family leucine-responsive transcriptional regulator [Pseudohongiellaceae bacterium]|jgi:Lrp/AsnC family leucine-responsive transcriptional regulator
MELDSQDLKILKILQVDARTGIDWIAGDVGLSSASVQRRLRRLRNNHVITAEVAIVSPKAVGRVMTFLLSVELERDNLDVLVKFKAKIKSDPRVQQCYYVTGESDFVLIVTAKDMDSFDVFTQEMFFNESNVRRYKTSVVMERTKVGLTLPLD